MGHGITPLRVSNSLAHIGGFQGLEYMMLYNLIELFRFINFIHGPGYHMVDLCGLRICIFLMVIDGSETVG